MIDLNRSFKFENRSKARQYNAEPYGLRYTKWNEDLKAEFAKYRKWRTSEFVPDRPRRLQQRDDTFSGSIKEFGIRSVSYPRILTTVI